MNGQAPKLGGGTPRRAFLAAYAFTVFAVHAPAASATERPLIVFWLLGDMAADIYVMDEDGGRLEDLTRMPRALNQWPAPSPDGKQIAFTSRRDGDRAIYTMDTDGDDVTRIGQGGQASWSPDGEQLVFVRGRGPGNGADLFIMDRNGRETRGLTDRATLDADPAWSPDGRRIAFVHYGVGSSIHVIGTDGRDERTLPGPPARDAAPAWSPDGTRIGFTRFGDRSADIYTMSAAGRSVRGITDTPDADEMQPSWSPDGRRLLFASNAENRERGAGADVYVMDADRGEGVRLLAHNGYALDPRWIYERTMAVSPVGLSMRMWGWLKVLGAP